MVANRISKENGHKCSSAKNDEIIFTGPDCKPWGTDGKLQQSDGGRGCVSNQGLLN